jgi:hypothetical protein
MRAATRNALILESELGSSSVSLSAAPQSSAAADCRRPGTGCGTNPLIILVGVTGFEPATPTSRMKSCL